MIAQRKPNKDKGFEDLQRASPRIVDTPVRPRARCRNAPAELTFLYAIALLSTNVDRPKSRTWRAFQATAPTTSRDSRPS
jgi:hypothetical protein